MENDIETKRNRKLENLIGILLMMPSYVLAFGMLDDIKGAEIWAFLLANLPVIIGIVLSHKKYKAKISKAMGITIFAFLGISVFSFYKMRFGEPYSWDGLGYSILLFIYCVPILKILLCVFYARIAGWKKALLFFALCILSIVPLARVTRIIVNAKYI